MYFYCLYIRILYRNSINRKAISKLEWNKPRRMNGYNKFTRGNKELELKKYLL